MIASKPFFAVLLLLLLCAAFVPRAQADQWDQLTHVTFTNPVEVPGMTLPPGKYTFSLMDDDADRNIVQIWNTDRTKLYATILAIPDYRLKPTGDTVLTFEERPSSQPEALRAWFYPGDLYGHEFVYPKIRATALAKRTGQPVLSMPNEAAPGAFQPAKSVKEPSVVAMKQVPVSAVQPSGEETKVAKAVEPSTTEHAAAAAHKHLPKTASWLPLWEVTGLVLLLAGLAAGRLARRLV